MDRLSPGNNKNWLKNTTDFGKENVLMFFSATLMKYEEKTLKTNLLNHDNPIPQGV